MKRFAVLSLIGVMAMAVSTAGALSETHVTFSETIAPIVFQQCAGCHRADGAAPFPLTSYEEVAKRARQIAAVTRTRTMPPWHAEAGSYRFKDERRLTDEQIALVQEWVRRGLPEGDRAKLPPLPEAPAGWQLGPPDAIVELPTGYQVPADGPDVYRNFVIPLSLDQDKWLRAIEFRPSARSAVHHVLFFADTSGAARQADAADTEPGFAGMGGRRWRNSSLGGWALGQQPHLLPEGIALPLRKGADLVLQYHFHPTGRTETERPLIGLHFADRAPARTLTSIQLPVLFGFFAGIDLPAGARDFRVRDSFVLPVDVDAVVIGAHAHYLGREMKMTATLPTGERKTLLWIKRWDFAWQDRYFFDELVPLPKGTRLDAEIAWDNSADNPDNPSDPPRRVTWGEQSTDEMGSIGLQVLPRRESELETLRQVYRHHVWRSAITGTLGADGPLGALDAGNALDVKFFLTHDCPISNYYAPEIRRLCERYAERGVTCRLVYVDPSLTDAAALEHARTYRLDAWPVIVDRDHRLVRAAGVKVAPEAAIFTADGRVRYRGRIDDRFVTWGEARRQPRTHDLRDALEALLVGKPAPQPETPPVGCIISDLLAASPR